MLKETGFCHGIENYSRHLEFRKPGSPPFALLDYLESVIHWYGQVGYFDQALIQHLKKNLELYKQGQLIDKTKEFLWMSSGRLYNKAVEMSSGDILVITPSDFLHLFSSSVMD